MSAAATASNFSYTPRQHVDIPLDGNIQLRAVDTDVYLFLCGPQTGGAEYFIGYVSRCTVSGRWSAAVAAGGAVAAAVPFSCASAELPEFSRTHPSYKRAMGALVSFYGGIKDKVLRDFVLAPPRRERMLSTIVYKE